MDDLSLTKDDVKALYFLQKYTFMTIEQTVVAIDEGRSYQNIGRRLRRMKAKDLVGGFGGQMASFGNTPKLYYIKKYGYETLLEYGFSMELLGKFKEKNEPKWTMHTKHRIYLIDLYLALERDIKNYKHFEIVNVFLDHKRIKTENGFESETSDFILGKKEDDIKINPDGTIILKSNKTKEVYLLLVEMDMGTETIVSEIIGKETNSLYRRMRNYDIYLENHNYADKYKKYGDFDQFFLLFITTSEKRVEALRRKFASLSDDLHDYYFFNVYDNVKNNFFCKTWKTRSVKDTNLHELL